jgi:uncharacterized protein
MGPLTDEIKDFVNKVKLGFIATVSPDGTPNLSPKGTTTAWDDNHLVFADIQSPNTVLNLSSNPAVELNVVDMFTRKGYRFKGIATVHPAGEFFDAVLKHFGEAATKYHIRNIVSIEVQRVLPIWSPVYGTNTTEEEILMRWTSYWRSVHP